MAENRWPYPIVDQAEISVSNGITISAGMIQLLGDTQQIRDVSNLVVSPYIGSIIPNLIADKRPSEQTITMRSNATSVVNLANRLRALLFVNYSSTKLYVQIFGVAANPAANAQPDYPPFVVYPEQTLTLGKDELGVDGFGFTECTVRVSTALLTYTPTASTAGLWQAIVRAKS
jgi:hypothetical protein